METNNQGVRTRTGKEEYSKIVSEWKSSGLSQRDFCNEYGYAFTRFQRWVWKCKSNKEEIPSIGRIRISDQNGVSSETFFEIVYPNGVKLRLNRYPGVEMFSQLIRY